MNKNNNLETLEKFFQKIKKIRNQNYFKFHINKKIILSRKS
jgi:hypothetical protein